MIWLDVLVQGILLGGLYALFAAGLSLVFGIMRLVNLAHGDLIVFAAFAILMIVGATGLNPFLAALIAAPLMFAAGWALQHLVLNRVLGKDILPPLLVTFGLSVALQNGMLEVFSADSQRISGGALESASIDLGPVTVGIMPLLTFAVGRRGDLRPEPDLLHAPRLAGRSGPSSDDPITASLMGIEPAVGLCHRHRACHGDRDHRRALPWDAVELRPLHRPGAADLCLRGGDHRRAWAACGARWPGGRSSGSRRRWGRRSTRNGRSWRGISPFWSC